MKKAVLFFLVFIIGARIAFAQYYHVDLNKRVPENAAWKVAHLSFYSKAMDSIKSYKKSVAENWAVISTIQTQIYKSLTNIDDAIKQGKRAKAVAKLIPGIFSNLAKASSIAAGKPYLMVYYNSTADVLVGQVINLQEYFSKFISSKNKKELMMDQVQRDIFLTRVFAKIQTIYNISLNMCILFKEYTLQKAINKIVPYKFYISLDKGIVNNIINRMKFE